MTLSRQFTLFVIAGLGAAIVHFGALLALVEAGGWAPEPATLVGYVAGGLVSYGLNRSLTYASDRPHSEAGWRFALVAGIGFAMTLALMALLHRSFGLHYLLAQVVTTGAVLVWSFLAHKLWTFSSKVSGSVKAEINRPADPDASPGPPLA